MDDIYQKHEDEFAPLIGKAIIGFANIEYFTYTALEILPNESIFKTACNLELCQRLDLLIEIVKGRPVSEKANTFVTTLNRCRKLAEKRNLIAHNPLIIESFGNTLTPRIKHCLKKNKSISLEELRLLCEEVDSLGSQLYGKLLSMFDNSIP